MSSKELGSFGEKIAVQINFFGPFLKKEEIEKTLDANHSDNLIETQRDLLKWFFDLPFGALSREILERYVEVTTEDSYNPIVPHTPEIFNRLLKPLKLAKKSYCLGDYSSTIALCGVVGEMLAILLWKINDVRLKGNLITEEEERGLFGRTFERLYQNERLRILKTFGHISDDQYKIFIAVQESRRPYMHLWSTDLKNEKEDALETLKKSFQLFKEITGIGLADAGTVKINPLMLKLFKEQKEI